MEASLWSAANSPLELNDPAELVLLHALATVHSFMSVPYTGDKARPAIQDHSLLLADAVPESLKREAFTETAPTSRKKTPALQS